MGWITHCPWCERLEQEQKNVPEGKGSAALKFSLVDREWADEQMAMGNFGAPE